MYIDGIDFYKCKLLSSVCLMFLLARFILIVDSAKPENPSSGRQMCTKLQSMLSYGKYHTSQISSNVTYTSRFYTQNFLAYSSMDDLLIFIEPKHQINVYNAQTIQLLVNLSTSDVVIATSTSSLLSDSLHDVFFLYETNSKTNLISIRVCQVHFNMFKRIFEDNHCIETITLQYDQPDLRINGFTIKRDHAGTKKSLLFISTDIGLIYTIFDTQTGSIIGESTIMNETLNEGSIVLSASGSIYYASKQEHLIYELNISRDFRLRYGKIIKMNAIKYPFGLITDECNHLYIATRSMILIMYVPKRSTIRSVFSKASDLPITLERLNSTTYVYTTMKKNSGKSTSYWAFNFLYFTDPERVIYTPRHPAVNWEEKLDLNDTTHDNTSIAILWPISYPSLTNTKKKYIQFSATARRTSARFRKKTSKQTGITNPIDREILPLDTNKLFTPNPSIENSITDLSDDSQSMNPDDNLEIDDNLQVDYQEQINQLLHNDVHSKTELANEESADHYSSSPNLPTTLIPNDNQQNDSNQKENLTLNQESRSTIPFIEHLSDSYLLSKHLNSTIKPSRNTRIHIAEILLSEDDIQAYLQGRENLTSNQKAQIQAYLAEQSSSDYDISSKTSTTTNKPNKKLTPGGNLSSEIQTEENISINEDTYLQDQTSKRPLLDSKFPNRTIEIAGTIFSEDDIQAYLEGRGNLSSKQEALIQAYLANQSSSDYNIFSKYSNTKTKPNEIVVPEGSLSSTVSSDKETSTKEYIQSQDYTTKRSLFDLKFINQTIEIAGTLFSEDDIQSYLEGRGNLSSKQEALVQAYLANQSSTDYNIFSKYPRTTTKPSGIVVPEDSFSSGVSRDKDTSTKEGIQSQDFTGKRPLFELKFINRTIAIGGTIFSEEDIQSYLEGRGNLSSKQEGLIQAYLANQSSTDYNIFSKYPRTTTKPSEIVVPEDSLPPGLSRDKDTSTKEGIQSQDYTGKRPLFDLKFINRTIKIADTLFSEDDIQSYLEGRGNLSSKQEALVQAYLANQSSTGYNIFSKYPRTTTKLSGLVVPEGSLPSEISRDKETSTKDGIQSQDYKGKRPLFELKFINRTIDIGGTIFSEDDIQSYLEGRGNLSSKQEALIEAYLANQSSTDYNIFSKYPRTTTKSSGLVVPEGSLPSEVSGDKETSTKEDIQSQDYTGKRPLFELKFINRTIDIGGSIFSEDDIQSYLEGRGNLSSKQEALVQAYLANQSPTDYHIFSKYSRTTTKPSGLVVPEGSLSPGLSRDKETSTKEDIQSQDYTGKRPLFELKFINRTIDIGGTIFSEHAIQSYLEGRGNLSSKQEALIQAYLANQSSTDYNIFSKYPRTTTKPSEIVVPEDSLPPGVSRDKDTSTKEGIQPQDYSTKRPLFDLKFINPTIKIADTLFSEDDIQSYLEGRGNLSSKQEGLIQAYLANQSSTDYNIFSKYPRTTTKPSEIVVPEDSLPPGISRDKDTSTKEGIQSQDYTGKRPLFDLKFINRTIKIADTLFSEDDIQSYLEGRGNLSSKQEGLIQAYLANQSSTDYNIFSKYPRTTTKPSEIVVPEDSLPPGLSRDKDTSTKEGIQSQDYTGKRPLFDLKFINRTIKIADTLFSEDDIQSYLEGRGNLSSKQEGLIQAYLANQSSTDYNIFSKYPRTTTKPSEIVVPEDSLPPGLSRDKDTSTKEGIQSQDYTGKRPLFDLKFINRTIKIADTLFSEDDIQSYLEGRGNLSSKQEGLIQAYLANQSSTDYNIFSKYPRTTTKPSEIVVPEDSLPPGLSRDKDTSTKEGIQSQDYTGKRPLFDLKFINRTIKIADTLFSEDDIQSYLEGRGNLSSKQEGLIQAYLANQSSTDYNIFSKYPRTTTKPSEIVVPEDSLPPGLSRDKDTSTKEGIQSQDYTGKRPLFDLKFINRTIKIADTLFSEDDIQSYLEGRGNLSSKQEGLIQAYLANQSSTDYNIFSKYPRTTTKSSGLVVPEGSLPSEISRDKETSTKDGIQSQDYKGKRPLFELKFINRTIDIGGTIFSEDDIQSYLEGRGNLSSKQEGLIQAYLANQSSTDYNIFSKYPRTTTKPSEIVVPEDSLPPGVSRDKDTSTKEGIQPQDYSTKRPLFDLKFINRTIKIADTLFSEDDIQSYLEGRGNLSSKQEGLIQAYLANQSSTDYNIFSKYPRTTTKSSGLVVPEGSLPPGFSRDEETSTKEDIQSQDYTGKRPLFELKFINRTIDIGGTIFSEDDIQSYLEGRGNLSSKQEALIQAYLANQSSTDYNIFSKYPRTTTKPSEIVVPEDSLPSGVPRDKETSTKEDTQSQDYTGKKPTSDSRFLNGTTDAEEASFSEDDIKSYLQGQRNFTSSEVVQIQTYLAKQLSSNHSLFSEYLTSTKKPTGIFVSDNDLQFAFETQDNGSIKRETESPHPLSKLPLSDSKSFNHTIDIVGTTFSEDEVQSYLQGRANLSVIQETQIQTYLRQKFSSTSNIFSNYFTSTEKPRTTLISDENIADEVHTNDSLVSDEHTQLEQLPGDSLSDYKRFNHTTDSLQTTFSHEDLKSYLQGRGNLSRSQEAQIKAYLAKQSSVNVDLFSNFLKTTEGPMQNLVSNDSVLAESDAGKNFSPSHDSQSQYYLTKNISSDSESINWTTVMAGTIFSEEDIQSYLEGKGNLTSKQETEIQAYLAKQSLSKYTTFPRYSKSTKPATGIFVSHDSIQPKPQGDNNSLQNYSTKQPSTDYDLSSEYFDHITDSDGTLISKDDLKSYLEGRSNLSASQETYIRAFLARQSSSYHNIFSKYSKSTTKPSGIMSHDEKSLSNSSTNGTVLFNEKSRLQNYSHYFNRTIDTDEILFSGDDLESYLQGRANLSLAQEAQIQAFLARQSSPYHNIFSKYSTSTKKPRRTSTPGNKIRPGFHTEGNLSLTEDIQSEDHSEELLPFDPTHYTSTTGSKEILFSEDDLRSYLEGRANLSKSEETKIQAYLTKLSSINQTISSKYAASTKKPRTTSRPGENIQAEFQKGRNLSLAEDSQTEDYSVELLPSDRKHYNHTTDSKEMLFSEDDLRSYLEGRANLSKSEEAEIQAYLTKLSSTNQTIFSKYSTSTKKPRRTSTPGNKIRPEFHTEGNLSLTEDIQSEDYSEELLPFDPTHYNRTTDSKEMLFSEDDLRSYLEDRANLSKSEEKKIQAYLTKLSSTNQTIFSKYSTSTKKPRRTSTPGDNIQPEFQKGRNLSLAEDSQSEDYSGQLLPSDRKHYNHTTGSEEMLFSEDDLRSYLDGRANLSKSEKTKIQAYLTKLSSTNQTIFSKYSTSTKKPRRTLRPGDNIKPEFQKGRNLSLAEDSQSEDYSEELLPSDPRHYNRTTDSEEMLFSEDDLRSYFEGRANLSKSEEAKIQAYLARQSSPNQTVFSKYSTSTKKPRRTSTPGDNMQPAFQKGRNLSLAEDSQSKDYSEELLPFDPTHYNRTTDSKEMLFSEDDLRSYLEGRANLSKSEKAKIQAYLTKLSSTNQTIFSKYSTSTKKPRRTSRPGDSIQPAYQKGRNLSLAEDSQSEDYSKELLPSDRKHYNHTTDSEEMIFSEDDLRSYLDGRANLSKSEKAKIQVYLTKLSSTNQTIFSKYSTSTKRPRRTSRPGDNIQPAYQKGRNLSLAEDSQSEDYSGELRTSDPKYYNGTTDSEEMFFSEDDLRSYLDGRANLSKSEEAKIQAYLTKLSSTNQTIFSKYLTSTKRPRITSRPADNIQPPFQKGRNLSLVEDSQSEDYSGELRTSDPKYYNGTIDSEEMLFSDDDLRSYLEGRANLSKSEEAEIQAYLTKLSSTNQTIFSKYSKSTKLPTRIHTPDGTINSDYQSEGIHGQNYITKTPVFDSKYLNFSTDSEEILFSADELQSYLQGRRNLSLVQEAQIQTYLAKQASLDNNTLSGYFTRTRKPTEISTSDGRFQIYSEGQTNLSLREQIRSSESSLQKLTSIKPYPTRKRIGGRRTSQSIINGSDVFDNNMEQFSDIYADSNDDTNISNDTLNKYSQLVTSTSSISRLLSDLSIKPSKRPFTYDSLPLRDHSRVTEFTPTVTDISGIVHPNDYDRQETDQDDDDKISLSRLPTKFGSTNHPRFSQIISRQTLPRNVESISLDKTSKPALSYPSATDPAYTPPNLIVVSHDNTTNLTSLPPGTNSSDTPIAVDQTEVSSPKIDRTIIPSIHKNITALQNQSHLNDTSRLYDAVKEGPGDQSVNIKQTSTLLTLIANDTVSLSTRSDNVNNNNIEDQISHKYSSPLSVDVNIPSTLHPSAPFPMSNTTLSPSRHSHLSSPLYRSLASSSTKAPNRTRLSSLKLFSEMIKTTTSLSSKIASIDLKPTTVLSYSTLFPSSINKLQSSHPFSSMQTTDSVRTSNKPERKSMTTLSDISSSPPFTTYHSRFKSIITSTLLLPTDKESSTTKSNQYTSKFPETHIETSSLPYAQSTGIFTTFIPSTNRDSSPKIISDKTSSHSTMTTANDQNLASSVNQPLESTGMLSLSSAQSSFGLISTIFPHYYKSKTFSTLEYTTFGKIYPPPGPTLPFRRRTSSPSTISTIATTTIRPYRTRKPKITRWQTQQLPTTITSSYTTITLPSYQTTSIDDHKTTTSTQISIWDSHIPLTNDLLNKIFNNISTSTNFSSAKSIYFNLTDLPPTSWNLSLNTNESINFDIVLPTATYPSYSNSTTNLTFTNIEANRFSTNIIGVPINLQMDRVQTKQFSLIMNATDSNLNRNRTPQHSSDVIIGHVKSEQFELNLTKSDNMHVQIQQVDSATAELFLDSNFCTNESSLEINLNLSKNGTIRYGNRTPINIGPVFTRVHMLKQSCDREQPLTLFFDVCERQNPCSNGGTCLSVMPDYNDISYTYTETGHVGYECLCPLHTSGEHCQYLQYQLGYCLNGGSLFQIYDRYNKSIETCICSIGFRGEHCEENIDDCIGISCSGYGICEDGIETYKCSCFDGFYGFNCERKNVQTVLLQAATRSFGVVAILLIALIAGLVVVSDIHTYLTRKQEKNSLLSRIPRATSELFENSVLLLGFSDAPIEMNDLANAGPKKKPVIIKQRQIRRTTRNRRPASYRQLSRRRRPLTVYPKSSSRRYLVANQMNQATL